jgi:hypothetical protein
LSLLWWIRGYCGARPTRVMAGPLELTARGVEVARERHRRVSESLQTLLADRTPGSDALIEATATHLRDLVSELEAALAEAAVRR